MERNTPLVLAMAEQCRALIQQAGQHPSELPQPLQRRHLLWMCEQLTSHADEWPVTRQNRWIGFIQAGMLANRMLDLQGIAVMFDEAKRRHAVSIDDDDLLDHLDPDSSFRLEIGGQG